MRGWRSAFTLIELVVVMAIMVIMGALAPMITSGVVLERQMYNMAAQLQQDLLLVQNQAITYSSGGPNSGSVRFAMKLYLTSNRFAYQTTEGAASLDIETPSPGSDIVVRTMPSTMGFPVYFGNTSLASVTIGASTTVKGGYVDVEFDNQGLPYWANSITVTHGVFTTAPTPGCITLTNRSASKQIQVTVSQIGRVSIAWVPGKK